MFCTMLGGTESCAMVRDAWRCCSSADVKEGALVSNRRASASEYVPSPTEWSVGSVFVPSVVVASGAGRCVACRTFQSYRIGFERNHFLLRGSVEKCATRNVKFRKC